METILKGDNYRLHSVGAPTDISDWELVTQVDCELTEDISYKFVQTPVDYTGTTQAPLEEFLIVMGADKPVNFVQFSNISAKITTGSIVINGVSDSMKSYFPKGDFGVSNGTYGMCYGFRSTDVAYQTDAYSYDKFVGDAACSTIWAAISASVKDTIGTHVNLCGDFAAFKTVGQCVDIFASRTEEDTRFRMKVYKKNLVAEVA